MRAAFANDKDKELKAQAEALLAKSRDLSNIQAPGSPGFALDAKIHYQIGAQSADGQGQIIYLAPDHYREVYTAPNYSYVEIVRDGYRYLARTNDEMPLLMYELRRAVLVAMHAGLAEKEGVKGVDVRQDGSGPLTCMTFKNHYLSNRCFDGDADVVTMDSTAPPSAAVLRQNYEFSNFAVLGTKRFPQTIVFRGGDGHVIEIHLNRLALVKDVPADAFRTPDGALKESWCAKPQLYFNIWDFLPSSTGLVNGNAISILAGAKASLYVVVGPTGRARTITVLESSKPIPKNKMDELLKGLRFIPLVCGKRGQEYEMEFGPPN